MALQQFHNGSHVQIEYKSYQLNPTINLEANEDIYMLLMKKYDLPKDKVKQMTDQLCEQGEQIGLRFQFDNLRCCNTFHAHRLVKFAEQERKNHLVTDLLFKKFFIDQENIGERDVLLSVAKEAKLNESEVDSLLCLNKFARAVENDQQMAEEIGISNVPFYIFNDQHALVGFQPLDMFVSILEELWKDESTQHKVENSKDTCKSSYCTGNDCE